MVILWIFTCPERKVITLSDKRKRKKKTPSKGRLRFRIAVKMMIMLFSLAGILGCMAGVFVNQYFEEKTGRTIYDSFLYGKESVKDSKRGDFKSDKATNIYSSDGTKISTIYKTKESTYLDYDEIPENVVNAFIAVEDRTFWENDGIDLKGIVRVMVNYIKTNGEQEHGASTITQQLARQKYLTLEKTLNRKVSEIAAAQELTKKYSKKDIMEFYVNMCCFANGVFGIQDASLKYFGKDVSEISLSQTAYLCAIPNWPEYYNPLKDKKKAVKRRDKILGDMLEMGYITKSEHDEAVAEKIKIHKDKSDKKKYNYETTYAIHCATKYIMGMQGFEFEYQWQTNSDYASYLEKYGLAYEQAKNELYSGGYDVHTTLDLDIQKAAQQKLDEGFLGQEEKLENGVYKVQGAMTVIDNGTGKVVAVVGGREQDDIDGVYTLNRAYQGYAQPGSSIKPIAVYAPSMEGDGETQEAYTPDSVLKNINVDNAKTATSEEISSMWGRSVYFRKAVENSLNGCAYWLMNQIGVQRGLGYLSDMKFSKIVPSDYNLSASLGGLTYGVTTEEMAGAYYALANNGKHKEPTCLKSMVDKDGEEVYKEAKQKRVYKQDTTDAITDVMKGVLTVGTARTSNWYEGTETEAAGKTGTTNENKAAWFCGYTPYYTIAVWVGCDKPEPLDSLTGSSYPLQIWQSTMLSLIKGKHSAKLAEMEQPKEPVLCTCSRKCEFGSQNDDCLLCANAGTEDELSLICKGQNLVCICTAHCEGDSLNELCPACVSNMGLCVEVSEATPCICTAECTVDAVNTGCPRCSRNWTICGMKPKPCVCENNCTTFGLNPQCEACSTNPSVCQGQVPVVEEPEPEEPNKPEEKPEKPDDGHTTDDSGGEKPEKPDDGKEDKEEDEEDEDNQDTDTEDGKDEENTDATEEENKDDTGTIEDEGNGEGEA